MTLTLTWLLAPFYFLHPFSDLLVSETVLSGRWIPLLRNRKLVHVRELTEIIIT